MMDEWRPKHVDANKWQKKDTILVHLLVLLFNNLQIVFEN